MAVNAFDVVISGGGVAGATVAVALGEFGYRVAVVEPGMDSSKRLAGELVHPPGTAALDELGLLDHLHIGEGSRVKGFSVRFSGDTDTAVVHLPYEAQNGHLGFAMEHSLMRERLLAAAARCPWVTVLSNARVTGADLRAKDSATVTVSSPAGEMRLRCRMLVAADGGSSPLSRLAGMVLTRHRVSTLFGVFLRDVRLPDPGYGHVLLGGSGPVLAYAISDDAVRVMFDVAPRARVADCHANLHALPEPLRSRAMQALHAARPVASASYAASMRQVVSGRLVLVGDAAGCCHPVTATGLTVCVRDALRLRSALRETGGDILSALPLYARLRRSPQRTRLVMARALHETFCAQTPESRLMCDGLREYWLSSTRRRTASMALLSTSDGRLHVMLQELAHVIRCGFGVRVADAWRAGNFSLASMRVLLHLSKSLLRHAGETVRTT